MITYKQNKNKIDVYLDWKLVGRIDHYQNGFAYFPRGGFNPGEVFDSVELVKHSLGDH